MAVDGAVGTSFRNHVLGGYHFIMRYYSPGDHIYLFGFSRGAYTARFLAEMIDKLGLLSRGNEEMVHFAWETFSNFQNSRGNDPQTAKDQELRRFMEKFRATFCRPGVGIHFLGLFDCVNSVGQFEIPFFRTSYRYISSPPARYIRHAVAIHERRLKFKPALFILKEDSPPVDLKEEWFAGDHSDIGGGWKLAKGQHHLLSDTPMNWMVQEALHLEGSESKLSFRTTNVQDIMHQESVFPKKAEPGTNAGNMRRRTNQPHDSLRFGHGSIFLMVLLWWVLGKFRLRDIPDPGLTWMMYYVEVLPLFTRLELEKGKWVPRRFPPNLGASRDIPKDGKVHESVGQMIKAGILDKDSIPKKGGDELDLPDPVNIISSFARTRKALPTQDADTKDSAGDNEVGSTPNGA